MQVKKQQLEQDMEQWTGSKLGKEYIKAIYCHPAYLYAEYILQNAGLDESQAGIKIAGRIVNNLRYADDTTLVAESEEELKSVMSRIKEESEKAVLKLNRLSKNEDHGICPITSRQIDGEKVETVGDFIVFCSKITADDDCSP